MYDTEFQVPFQGVYENTKIDDISSRYCFVVDGEYYNGSREKFVSGSDLKTSCMDEKTSSLIPEVNGPPQPSGVTATPTNIREISGRALVRELLVRIKSRLRSML